MTANKIQSRRSFIFTPGNRPEYFTKALTSGADIVCVELEDGVAPHDKDEARAKMLELFAEPHPDDGIERIVRVNCGRTIDGMADLEAILRAHCPVPSIMLPKVKGPKEIRGIAEMFEEHGLETRIQAIIETNEGLEAAYEIAQATPRLDALLFGAVDLAAELRCTNSWEAMLYARSRTVHAAAAAGIDVIDVPWLDLEDMEGMRREAESSAGLGFTGKGAIHPKQIAVLNQVYSPDPDEVAYARKVIDAYAQANTGVVVVDGKLIERPVLRTMHLILARAERADEG
ncbi:MAG: (S)-citramalyl-CoA lyase [Alphaproteobacteria bacterium]|jgi:(S)-citramalyl-CoA lyase